jgi:hypothetical protein
MSTDATVNEQAGELAEPTLATPNLETAATDIDPEDIDSDAPLNDKGLRRDSPLPMPLIRDETLLRRAAHRANHRAR